MTQSQQVKCTRTGCGQLFDPANNSRGDACRFHPGNPVFQDGRKHYSCCPHTKVSDFDAFVNLQGCTLGTHSLVESKPTPPPTSPSTSTSTSTWTCSAPATTNNSSSKTETFTTTTSGPALTTLASATTPPPPPPPRAATTITPALPDQDPPNAIVAPGTTCLRKGCGIAYESDAITRATPCVYHPGAPLFHEGSKGWTCCRSKSVLEFESFLKIKGCTTGHHVFVKPVPPPGASADSNLPKIRRDWYQTRDQVIVALFAKNCQEGKGKTKVLFRDNAVDAELHLPDGTIVTTGWSTYLPIDTQRSTFKIMGTKVEIVLQKQQGISWPALEASEADVPISEWTTFGAAGGRFGTVGGKEVHYLGDAPLTATTASSSFT